MLPLAIATTTPSAIAPDPHMQAGQFALAAAQAHANRPIQVQPGSIAARQRAEYEQNHGMRQRLAPVVHEAIGGAAEAAGRAVAKQYVSSLMARISKGRGDAE